MTNDPPGIDPAPLDARIDFAAVSRRDPARDELAAMETVARVDTDRRRAGEHGNARLDELLAAGRPVFPGAAVVACQIDEVPEDAHVRIDRVADRLEADPYTHVDHDDVDELRAIAHDLRLRAAHPRMVVAWDTPGGHVATVNDTGAPDPHPDHPDAAHDRMDGPGATMHGASS